jgi:hypothetical protein
MQTSYYYPLYLHMMNLFSFTYYNSLPGQMEPIIKPMNKNTKLWSITRTDRQRGPKHKKEYIVSYNHVTQQFEFCDKRYLSYQDVVNDALRM